MNLSKLERLYDYLIHHPCLFLPISCDQCSLIFIYMECRYGITIISSHIAFQSYGVSIEDVLAVELSAGPSLDEIKKLPNKVLLWCGGY